MASEAKSLFEAHEWCVEQPQKLEKYPGKWVAVSDGEIIAVGQTYEETYREAKKKAPGKIPLITYVPREGEELLIL